MVFSWFFSRRKIGDARSVMVSAPAHSLSLDLCRRPLCAATTDRCALVTICVRGVAPHFALPNAQHTVMDFEVSVCYRNATMFDICSPSMPHPIPQVV